MIIANASLSFLIIIGVSEYKYHKQLGLRSHTMEQSCKDTNVPL